MIPLIPPGISENDVPYESITSGLPHTETRQKADAAVASRSTAGTTS